MYAINVQKSKSYQRFLHIFANFKLNYPIIDSIITSLTSYSLNPRN